MIEWEFVGLFFAFGILAELFNIEMKWIWIEQNEYRRLI